MRPWSPSSAPGAYPVRVHAFGQSDSDQPDGSALARPSRRSDATAEVAALGIEHPRILLVEDDPSIRDLLCFHLDLAGFDCLALADGMDALGKIANEQYDLVVLDVMLPGLDGLMLCKRLRREGLNREVPVLMVTARDGEADKVLGLETGADDYVTKPFSIREVLARVSALLRRRSTRRAGTAPGEIIRRPGVVIDVERRRVLLDGHQLTLTPHEFELLVLLASSPGVPFSRRDLLRRVWTEDVNVTLRGVDTLVKRLRRKVEPDPDRPTRILTVWALGYQYADD